MGLLDPKKSEVLPSLHEIILPNETSIAERILAASRQNAPSTEDETAQSQAISEMERMGWSLEEDLRELRLLKQYSDNEKTKLECLRLSLGIRKVINDRGQEAGQKPVTFIIQGDNKVEMNAILNPNR